MSTTQTRSEIAEIIDEHLSVAGFLTLHKRTLEALSYHEMREKMPDEVNLPWVNVYAYGDGVSITVHGKHQRETMRTLRRAIGGKWDKKSTYGERFRITREWGEEGTVTISVEGKRDEICQRVVTGTRIEETAPIEAQPAKTEVVEIVEWVCGSLLED